MIDQAASLRKSIEEYTRKKQNKSGRQIKVISVASGKGGVGKTNFSVNLAISLKEMGNNVVVLDADFGMANVDVIIGVIPRYNLYDVIFNNKNLEEIIINGPAGIKVIPGGSGIESLSNLTDTQRRILSDKFGQLKDTDILVIDTGAGMSKNVLGFMAVSDDVIIVTTPEPTSITDAYSLIKVAIKYVTKSRLHIVVNKTSNDKEASLTFQKLNGVVKNFLNKDINYLGYIIDDNKVKRAVMEQKPFKLTYPECQASKCIDGIAFSIMGFPNAINKEGSMKGFFSKVALLLGRLNNDV